MTTGIERHPREPRPWRVRYRHHDGADRLRSFTRRADAERFAAQLRTAAALEAVAVAEAP